MYAESVVERRLSLAGDYWRTKGVNWKPVYHSTSEIDEFNAELKKSERRDKEGKIRFTRDLTRYEAEFIRNEKVLAHCDAAYWMTRYAYVKDERGIIKRFQYRIPQKLYFDIICSLEARRASIELLNLKARQLGMSTITELLVAHRIFYHRGVNAIVASADKTKSAIMAQMMFLAYDQMPWWVRPKWSRRVESDNGLFEFASLNSGVSIQHGRQMSGIARGTTPTVYHLSEASSFTKPLEQIESAILRAVHASPKVFGVVESTAAGDTGWFPEKWEYSKEEWNEGRARFCPLFLPWFCGVDIYPTSTWLVTHPLRSDWEPRKETKEHVAKAELFVRTNDMLRRHLGTNYSMPLKQQWFWEVGYAEAERTGGLSKWFQEMPADDIECFQSSFESVFGREVIELAHNDRQKKFDAYGIVGQSIEASHEPWPELIDYDRTRIPIVCESKKSDSIYRWEMVPLKYEVFEKLGGKDKERELINDVLFVYQTPKTYTDYSFGIDTSNGIGRDASVMCMSAKGDEGMPDIQAAEFRSHTVGHVEAFAFALPIALWYARKMLESTGMPFNQPNVGVEQIASVGDTCQLQMRNMGYSRFHKFIRYDKTKIQKSKSRNMGWYTTGWSRPILVGYFVHAVKNGWYKLNSATTVEECREFEIHYTDSGKEKLEHAQESWDDGIFAAAISTFISHDLDTIADREKRKYVPPERQELPPVDIGVYGGMRLNPNTKRLTHEDLPNLIPGWGRQFRA